MIVFALSALQPTAPAVAGEARQLERDCSVGPTGNTPLTDLATGSYLEAQGGLYPLGSNEIPPSHLALGLHAPSLITPLDATGQPDPAGVIGFAAVGFSNSHREFAEFIRTHGEDSRFEDAVRLVNLAQGGQHIAAWADSRSRAWRQADEMLAAAGVTAAQVQVLWVKMAERLGVNPDDGFPANTLRYEEELSEVLRLLDAQFPNLQVAYISSRAFGGYNTTSSPSPEPIAYEEGFGVKWTIEAQIGRIPELNADPAAGDVVAPWIAWGPYLWADGVTARSDGLTWQCRDFRGDGVHTEGTGLAKVADQLMAFLEIETYGGPAVQRPRVAGTSHRLGGIDPNIDHPRRRRTGSPAAHHGHHTQGFCERHARTTRRWGRGRLGRGARRGPTGGSGHDEPCGLRASPGGLDPHWGGNDPAARCRRGRSRGTQETKLGAALCWAARR